jgi:nucleotide-binding universal stress UspA family protein
MLEHLNASSGEIQPDAWENQQRSPFTASDADDASYRRSHGGAASTGAYPAFEVKRDPGQAPARATLPGLLERKPQLFRRILVAVDQSEQATWAVDVAARVAGATGAELAMVHVVVDGTRFGSGASAGACCLSGEQQGAEIIRELALRVPKGLRVVKILRYGVAGREIVNAASEWGADLIVIGTHGRGTVSRFFLLLGSVADHVLRYAECPVMTVSHQPAPAYAFDRAAAPWGDQAMAAEAIAGTPMCS